jgi:methionyl aminopeptidase
VKVPPAIRRPEYVGNAAPRAYDGDNIYDAEAIDRIRRAGRIASGALDAVGAALRPGMTTTDVDAIGHEYVVAHGAYPSTLGYRGYPKSSCTSLNEVICHGIPDSTVVNDGDIINLDVTCYVNGVHGDTNATFFVGEVDEESKLLTLVAEECMWKGIEAVVPGRPISDVGKAIETHAKLHRMGVIRAFIGHGIGELFHSDIQVLHYFDSRNNMIMRPGMTFTVEPMISLGTWQHKMWDDDWTAVTADGKRTAQFEHTLFVTETGVEVLTAKGAVSPSAPWKRV